MRKILIMMMLCALHASGWGQDEGWVVPESRNRWNKIFCEGNLTGLGIGLNYSPTTWIGFDGLVGFQLPYSPIWASPYRGNEVAMNLRLRLMHRGGFYIAAGWFGGAYEIKITANDLDAAKLFFVQAPTAAIGFAWPGQPTDVQILLEAGAVFGLPKKLSGEASDPLAFYRLSAERSSVSTGNLLPFFTILFQL